MSVCWETVINSSKPISRTSVLYQNEGYKLLKMYNFVLCLIDCCGPYNEFVKQKAGVTCFNILANLFFLLTHQSLMWFIHLLSRCKVANKHFLCHISYTSHSVHYNSIAQTSTNQPKPNVIRFTILLLKTLNFYMCWTLLVHHQGVI